MDRKITQLTHRVTALILIAAAVFYVFFQTNKRGPFLDLNPFANDPYDAVGSFAIQIALLIGLLNYGRALRLREDAAQVNKIVLIVRGNALVLLSIWVTLIADGVALRLHRMPASFWTNVLWTEMAAMTLFAVACSAALAVLIARVPTVAPPSDLTPADGIDDLWTLVRAPMVRARTVIPGAWVAAAERFNADALFARFPWTHARRHPWRFACVLGLFVGVGLAALQLEEGAPSLKIAILVALIFISAEFIATLAGFAIFGGYLGLRPAIHRSE
jgi:hypothetical protein